MVSDVCSPSACGLQGRRVVGVQGRMRKVQGCTQLRFAVCKMDERYESRCCCASMAKAMIDGMVGSVEWSGEPGHRFRERTMYVCGVCMRVLGGGWHAYMFWGGLRACLGGHSSRLD